MRYLIGVGDFQSFDDSIGLRVAERAAERMAEHATAGAAGASAESTVRVIELGGRVIDLVHYLGPESERVLVVDAAVMGAAAGEHRFLDPADVRTRAGQPALGGHTADVLSVLDLAARVNGALPPVTLMGIQPHDVRPGAGLSPVLAAKLDEYVAAALDFLLE